MRPQHITAENVPIDIASDWEHTPGFNEAAAYHCGKRISHPAAWDRRPRFNEAAAYHCGKRGRQRPSALGGLASMRPQHITAENVKPFIYQKRTEYASMRPQHITAENSGSGAIGQPRVTRFNEAAAYHCGKPRARRRARRQRPRFNEAAAYHCGKRAAASPSATGGSGFNEAAAYHCGKRAGRYPPAGAPARFNEAAAYHCGKRVMAATPGAVVTRLQ